MDITFHNQNFGGCYVGGPVYSEPQEGFFKSKGFPAREYNDFCDIESCKSDTVFALLGKERKDEALHLGPVFSRRHVAYYSHGDGWLQLGSMGCGRGRSVTGPFRTASTDREDTINALTVEELEKMNPAAVAVAMHRVSDELRRVGGACWSGHVLSVQTEYSVQRMVLEESVQSATAAASFSDFMHDAICDVYGRLDARKLQKSKTKILRAYDRAGKQYMRKYFEVLHNGEPKQLPKNLGEAALQEWVVAWIGQPGKDWAAAYSALRDEAGLTAADDALFARVGEFATKHNALVNAEKGNNLIQERFDKRLEDVLR